MTVATLRGIFENEIAYCLKAMEAFSKLDQSDPSCNSRRRLLLDQFQKCWDQYGPYLPKDILNTRLVEVGEALIRLENFHEAANILCFTKYLKEVSSVIEDDRVHKGVKSADDWDVVGMSESLNTKEVELIRRCQFGSSLSEFLSLYSIDLTLQAVEVRGRAISILKKIVHIVKECSASPDYEWLALEGAKHLLILVNSLWDAEYPWDDAQVFLVEAASCLQKCSAVHTVVNVVSLVDVFDSVFQKRIIDGDVDGARQIHSECSQIVDKSIGIGPLSNDDEVSKNYAFNKLNNMLLMVTISAISNGEAIPYNNLDGTDQASPFQFRKITGDTHQNCADDEKRSSPKIKFLLDHKTTDNGRHTLVIPSRRKSVTMTSQLKANIEARIVKYVEPFKPVNAALIMKKLSVTSKTIQSPIKFKLDFSDTVQKAVESDMHDVESIAGSAVAIPASLVDNSLKAKKPPPPKSKKAKGVSNNVETEEQKAKRLVLAQLVDVLRFFPSDKEKLRTLIMVLDTLSKAPQHKEDIKVSETKKSMQQFLLDLGFELMIMPAESVFQKGGILSSMIGEMDPANFNPSAVYNIGKLPCLQELNRLVQDSSLQRFGYEDLMKLCRIYFSHTQYERFSVVAQSLEHCLRKDLTAPQFQVDKYVSEIGLRASIINFQNVWHSERKVAFRTDDDLSATAQDLRWRKLEVSDAVHDASISLIQAMSDCLEIKSVFEESSVLFIDSARLLWSFVEPLVQEYLQIDDRLLADELMRDDIVVKIMRSIHLIAAEFPNKEIEFGIMASLKFTELLEKICDLDDAIDILEQTCARITEARGVLGDGSGSLDIVAAHAGIHLKHLIELSNSSDEKDKVKLTIPCLEIEAYKALFRCDMKRTFYQAISLQNKRKEEYERLTKKQMKTKLFVNSPSDSYVKFMCGENTVLKAILLTVHASSGQNLSIIQKHSMLLSATMYLRKQAHAEKTLLIDMSKKSTSSGFSPMKCPMPTIIRRTPFSITIRPNHMVSESGHLLVPSSYQGFCKKFGAGKVALNDTDYPGSGDNVIATERAEITFSGLEPNTRYMFAVAAFDESGQIMGCGIGETSKGCTAMFSLPLVYCWCDISIVSHDLSCDDVADIGFSKAWNYFVKSMSSREELLTLGGPGITGVGYNKTFTLHENNVKVAPTELKRLFIRCIHKKVDREFGLAQSATHTNSIWRRNIFELQLTRLKAVRILIVAAEISSSIEDYDLVLQTATKIMCCLFPFFESGIEGPFAVHAALLAHDYTLICDQNKVLLDNEVILGVLSPLALHLARRLIHWKEFSAALKISEDMIQYLNCRSGSFDSTSIANSAAIELQWTGIVPRTKKYTTNQRKSILNNLQSDNMHQVIVAVSRNYNIGYNQPKILGSLIENFEFCACHSQMILHPPMPFEKRSLEPLSSLKDIYHVFTCCGNDALIAELLKYKKNPRYLEILSIVMHWNFIKENTDSVVKVTTDLLEWVSLRNRFMSHAFDVMEDSLDGATKDMFLTKKRRPFFVEKRPIVLDIGRKQERKSRSRSRQPKNINSLVDGGITRERSKAITEEDVSPSPLSRQEESSSRPTSKERHVSRSRSPSAERASKEAKEATSGLRGIGRKRKRMAQRNILLAGLGQVEKDRLEKSVKCLDSLFGRFWKQKRLARRLRLIIKQESRWKSELVYTLALSHLKKIDMDLCGQNNIVHQSYTSHEHFIDLQIGLNYQYRGNPITNVHYPEELSDSSNPFPISDMDVSKLVPEVLQCLVQSVVLAARVKVWKKVSDGCKAIWNVTQILLQRNYLSQEFIRTFLWKPFFVAGDYLLDMLANTKISIDTIRIEDPLAGRCLPHVFEETTGKVGIIPAVTYEELITQDYVSSWTNAYGESEKCSINLPWIASFLMYGLDCMLLVNMPKRAIELLKRLNDTFRGIFVEWCSHFLKRAGVSTNTFHAQFREDINSSLNQARMSFIAYVSEKKKCDDLVQPSVVARFTDAFENYAIVLQRASKLGDKYRIAEVCSEYGDLWCAKGDIPEAMFYWAKAIDNFFGNDPSKDAWKKFIQDRPTILQRIGGTKYCLQAITVILKMKSFGSFKDLEKESGFIMLCMHLLMAVSRDCLPCPIDPMVYAHYNPLNLTQFFRDRFSLDPLLLASLLNSLAIDLLGLHMPNEALITASYSCSIGGDVLTDNRIFTQATLVKSRVLLEMGFVQLSIEKLLAIFNGSILLHNRRNPIASDVFNCSEPIFQQTNWQIIKALSEAKLNETSKRYYGDEITQQIEVQKGFILTKLLQTVHASDPASGNPVFCSLLMGLCIKGIDHPYQNQIKPIFQSSVDSTTTSSFNLGFSALAGFSDVAKSTGNITTELSGTQNSGMMLVPDWSKSLNYVLQCLEESTSSVINWCKSQLCSKVKQNLNTWTIQVLIDATYVCAIILTLKLELKKASHW
ncbi:hypothetical protein BDR26DRAFT_580606 [Obelidium mucronatum]|nr:hypothetical protein BDR26DRAFT_580606 [Obelidium mucronatum]